MRTGQRLTIAVAAAALSFSTLSVAAPAGAAPDSTDTLPDGPIDVRDMPVLTPPLVESRPVASSGRGARDLTSARSHARPRFAFWGKKYNRIDGFSFTTAHRGSGTALRVDVAWKRQRSGLQPKHAADCATLAIYPSNRRTYGGYCNVTELAAAAVLWQNARY